MQQPGNSKAIHLLILILTSLVSSKINLFSIVRLNQKASQEATQGSKDEERKRFLSGANCIKLTNPVDLQRTTAYCLDTLPEMVPLYGPEDVLFMKTENPRSVDMLMRMYAHSWENLDIDKLKEKQERRRTLKAILNHHS